MRNYIVRITETYRKGKQWEGKFPVTASSPAVALKRMIIANDRVHFTSYGRLISIKAEVYEN